MGTTGRMTVTVVARDCMTADSLASAVSVLGPERGMKLIDATPGADALIVRQNGVTIERYESNSMPSTTGRGD